MIIQCNSCAKKFVVQDSAITANGRLVQCSSCGNKWTQYPVKSKSEKKTTKIPDTVKAVKTKASLNKKKKKKNIDTYSPEYLQKKHGIKIIDPSSLVEKTEGKRMNNKKLKERKIGYGFYNYLITIVVFIITLLGILNLTEELLVQYYPDLEIHINYLFETINNITTIIQDILSNY